MFFYMLPVFVVLGAVNFEFPHFNNSFATNHPNSMAMNAGRVCAEDLSVWKYQKQ
jgi:hypothetical protein